MKILKRVCAFAPLAALVIAAAAHAGPTMDAVKKRGNLICGVSQGLPGFSSTDEKGRWKGLDVDYCHALAATIFGDATKVKFVPLSAKERFTALQSGEIDILSRNTTWTMTRDTQLGLNFVGVDFYDGQSFMIRKNLGLTSAKQLDGATVCSNAGTTTELNMADYFRSHGMKFTPVVFENSDQVIAAYDSGRCDVYTTDRSGLVRPAHQAEEPRRQHHPAGSDFQGTAGAGGSSGRRRLVQCRRSGLCSALINAEELRRHLQERRRDAQVQEPQDPAPAGGEQQPGREHRHGERLGLPR